MNIFKTKYRVVEDKDRDFYIEKAGVFTLWFWMKIDVVGGLCFVTLRNPALYTRLPNAIEDMNRFAQHPKVVAKSY